MPRGTPDYGSTESQTASIMFDPGALVPLLRGITSVDNKGRVIYATDFSGGLSDWSIGFGVGASVELDFTQGDVYHSPVSVKLDPGGASALVGITKLLASVSDGRIGVEIALQGLGASETTRIRVSKHTINGRVLRAELMYSRSNTNWTLLTTGGAEEDALDFSSEQNVAYGYRTIKIVADFNTGYYDKLIVGTIEYDLSEFALYDVSSGGGQLLECKIQLQPNATYIYPEWVGAVIVTIDEP